MTSMMNIVKSAQTRILSRPFTKNQVKVSFQDHPPNVPKNGPKSGSFKTIESQNVHKKGSFKTIEDGSKNDTSFKNIGENDQKSTSFKTIANRVKNLNP